MAKHRGKWISHAIKKAAKDYECRISGDTITKGEHYLNIQVATDEVGFNTYGNTFSIQETFAVALSQLAHKSFAQILDLLPPFLDEKDKKIAELKKELAQLREYLSENGYEGKIRRDFIIKQLEDENKILRQTVISLLPF